jgi:protein-disulfide isomerase
MSSRALRKAEARQVRVAAEAADRHRAARRRAIVRVAAMAAVAAVLVVVAAVVVGPGRDPDTAAAAPDAGRVFDGIPQVGIALGSADAPAVLTEFADLQCPFCATYARDVLPAIVDRYVRSGRLRLELHVLSFLGDDSVRAGAMAAAAAEQNRLWSFADGFYRSQGSENSGYATDAFLRGIGEATPGLDVARAFGDRDRPAVRQMLADANDAARAAGVESTPAFSLRRGDRPAESLEPEALTDEAFTAALDEALAAR